MYIAEAELKFDKSFPLYILINYGTFKANQLINPFFSRFSLLIICFPKLNKGSRKKKFVC